MNAFDVLTPELMLGTSLQDLANSISDIANSVVMFFACLPPSYIGVIAWAFGMFVTIRILRVVTTQM